MLPACHAACVVLALAAHLDATCARQCLAAKAQLLLQQMRAGAAAGRPQASMLGLDCVEVAAALQACRHCVRRWPGDARWVQVLPQGPH